MTDPNEPPPILCYVAGCVAWFTTAPLDRQWGDDWDDAPYEHNAGEPYRWHPRDADRGLEPYELTRVIWLDADLLTPDSDYRNSPYSVQRINQGVVPWLVTSRWHSGAPVAINAGSTIPDFKAKVREAGGRIFIEELDVSAVTPSTPLTQEDPET